MNKDVRDPPAFGLRKPYPLIALNHSSSPKTRSRRLSAYFIETALVIDGSRDPIASRRFDEFFKEANISVEPVTLEQARLARQAYRDFGKGSGHPAKLKFGDCFAYAWSTSPCCNVRKEGCHHRPKYRLKASPSIKFE